MDTDFSQQYHDLEKHHWWFRARREILSSLISKAQLPNEADILEIGVGSGENLYSVYPSYCRLTGIEPFSENAAYADARGDVPVYQGTAEEWPEQLKQNSFDMICLFDVLEHLEDDELALRQFHDRLNSGGYVALSVPAYEWMWGRQDEVSHHYRRYTRKLLQTRLKQNNFDIVYTTYFNTLLFPAIVLQRLGQKITGAEGSDFDQRYGTLEHLFYRIFRAEKHLAGNFRLPFGVSLFALAHKT